MICKRCFEVLLACVTIEVEACCRTWLVTNLDFSEAKSAPSIWSFAFCVAFDTVVKLSIVLKRWFSFAPKSERNLEIVAIALSTIAIAREFVEPTVVFNFKSPIELNEEYLGKTSVPN